MNKLLLLLMVASGLFISCGDDNGIQGEGVLHYDGDNFQAPILPAGTWRFGIRFSSVVARSYTDRVIESVAVYMYELPTETRLTISTDLSGTSTGDVITSQVVTGLRANAWNTIPLDEPVTIDGNAFWIDLQVRLPDQMQSVGCDQGPAASNGDWLYDNGSLWERYSVRTAESVNWNIRAVLD